MEGQRCGVVVMVVKWRLRSGDVVVIAAVSGLRRSVLKVVVMVVVVLVVLLIACR